MDNEYIATYICMNIITQCCTMWMSYSDKNELAIYKFSLLYVFIMAGNTVYR